MSLIEDEERRKAMPAPSREAGMLCTWTYCTYTRCSHPLWDHLPGVQPGWQRGQVLPPEGNLMPFLVLALCQTTETTNGPLLGVLRGEAKG